MVTWYSYKQVFAMGLFFITLISCTNNLKDVQNIGISENEPIGVAENINLKYTDSGKIKAILKSPKMYDYGNMKFPYNEFTEGVNLEVIEDGKKSVIISDYAVFYKKTNIIDLQGNVKITTHSNDTLFAEQLYYDESKEWLFTNSPVTFRTGQDLIHGNGFDSNSKFTNAEVLEITGLITVDE
ncbi:LPS export ABC transporter periplasmic protein LptC [Hyunsoonleella ulvae]|uniref:LPS export ABC transporter periplasmic protein LptC n=1 Tax=Hyunsoonleella ulvae TaxID=2799948 RepID=UPI001939E88A|nr:LPS export ABC transporter periplasmic protein LptC [Hyunsoonleella ulvae]